MACRSESEYWYLIESEKKVSQYNNTVVYNDTTTIPSSLETSRFRREITGVSAESLNESHELEEHTVHISCGRKVLGHAVICMDVSCTIRNLFKERFFEIGFDMYFVKKTVDLLLENEMEAILVETLGSAAIFEEQDMDHTDKDSAQTRFTQPIAQISWWVYFAAAFGGIFLLSLISLALFKVISVLNYVAYELLV